MPFIPVVAKRFEAARRLREVRLFECVHCRETHHALVLGLGVGRSASPYFLFNARAAREAAEGANAAARANLELTIRLATCPHCGRRDENALRRARLPAILGIVALAIATALVSWFYVAVEPNPVGVAFFIPVGCVVSYLVWRNQRWKWDTAHQRVDFISAEDARDHDVHGQRGAQREKKKRRVKN
jgi:hypothetical protein